MVSVQNFARWFIVHLICSFTRQTVTIFFCFFTSENVHWRLTVTYWSMAKTDIWNLGQSMTNILKLHYVFNLKSYAGILCWNELAEAAEAAPSVTLLIWQWRHLNMHLKSQWKPSTQKDHASFSGFVFNIFNHIFPCCDVFCCCCILTQPLSNIGKYCTKKPSLRRCHCWGRAQMR